MSKLSPIQQEHNRQRGALASLANRIRMVWSFGKIKTWSDVYDIEGIPPEAQPENRRGTLTFPELKAYLEAMRQRLEDKIAGVVAPAPVVSPKVVAPIAAEPKAEPLVQLAADENYGLVPSPNEKTFYYWFQKQAITQMLHGMTVDGHRGQLLLSSTGTGKTFMVAGLVRRLVDMKFADKHTFGATRYLYVTRATIVEQTKRVFHKYFNLSIRDGVEILNIEQLRSRAGAQWVKETMVIVDGKEQYVWEWKKHLNPVVILWDECQALKNEGSIQHQIAASFNSLDVPTWQVFISATPFTRVSEAKCFACSTRKTISDVLGTNHQTKLTLATWPTYASFIAGSQSAPTDYNEAAVERLTKDLEPYIIRVKGVRPQFNAQNRVEMIDFETKEDFEFYSSAWERYLKEKAEAEKDAMEKGEKVSGLAMLVMFLKFRMAAEIARKRVLARKMYEAVSLDGKAAVAALNFKGSIIGIVKILVDEYKVPRDQISLIWGGGKTGLTRKEKAALEIQSKAQKLIDAGMSTDEVMKMLDIEPEDLVRAQQKDEEVLPEHLRLGPQSQEERQHEIDRFQSGKSLFCLYTFRAGGVGLSLHHTDEFSAFKCRRKESGYAVEEDIAKVPIRPRRNFVAPTYSAIELVQGLGRCPRLTSLSVTEQFLLFYRGTIEQDVAAITSQKLRCLGKVVRQREDWQDIITSGGATKSKHMMDIPDDDPDELEEGEDE